MGKQKKNKPNKNQVILKQRLVFYFKSNNPNLSALRHFRVKYPLTNSRETTKRNKTNPKSQQITTLQFYCWVHL